MKSVEMNCAHCKEKFLIALKEHKRQIKRGRTEFFCSRTCSATKNNLDNPRPGNKENLRSKQKDQYTPFRWFVLRAEFRDRKKKFGCNISIQYLKQLWEEQHGICPFTGWSLILPDGTGKAWLTSNLANASLDRIDNTNGYVEGNVRFIALAANYARNTFSDEELITFCKAVANNK